MFAKKEQPSSKVVASTTATAAQSMAPKGPLSFTLISADTTISGSLESSVDVRVEGVVNASIKINGRLIVGEGGVIHSQSILCNSAEISGTIEGDITTENAIVIRPNGLVNGNITAAEIIIEQGGLFNGNCQINQATDPKRSIPTTAQPAVVTKETKPESAPKRGSETPASASN